MSVRPRWALVVIVMVRVLLLALLVRVAFLVDDPALRATIGVVAALYLLRLTIGLSLLRRFLRRR
ncbi:MAG: hypothetical protein ABI776_19440 [Nocardioidaceae bacterium]